MPELNSIIPSFDCWVRAEYLYNLESHKGEFVQARAFGISSIQGRAIGFHVLDERGACIWRLPINSLVTNKNAPDLPLDHLELWDCFSYQVSVTEFDHLSGRRCQAILKDASKHEGRYKFTVDWYGSEYAEGVGDSGHKCAHIIDLDNGCLCALPNNRILWADPGIIEKPFEKRPDYKTNTHIFSVENKSKWSAGEGMFYDVTLR